MQLDRAVISSNVAHDVFLRICKIAITFLRQPLCFQAPEEAFHRTVIPAVSTSAQTLLYLTSSQLVPEPSVRVMAALTEMEHQICRSVSVFPRPLPVPLLSVLSLMKMT